MVIQGNANISLAAGLTRAAAVPQVSPPAAGGVAAQNQPQVQRENLARRFDSVTISAGRGSSQFQEVKSRLLQEVRTSQPAESVDSLREQFRSGQYTPDPRGIAAKMLLMGEER